MFITFEGVEGSGKGTMLKKSIAWLEAKGKSVFLSREPGGSRLGVELRAMLLDIKNQNLTPEAELFLYLADRAQHVAEVLKPALHTHDFIISDRYADSTIVYQGFARGLNPQQLFELNDLAVKGFWPHLTLVLDLDPCIGLERAQKRNTELALAEKEGRFEAESISFHNKVRQGYLDLAAQHPQRIKIINAAGTPAEVFTRIEVFLLRAISL